MKITITDLGGVLIGCLWGIISQVSYAVSGSVEIAQRQMQQLDIANRPSFAYEQTPVSAHRVNQNQTQKWETKPYPIVLPKDADSKAANVRPGVYNNHVVPQATPGGKANDVYHYAPSANRNAGYGIFK